MINYLLDHLQPYIWTKKSECVRNFGEYFFSQYPDVTPDDARDILCGREMKGRGLLQAISNRTWPSGHLKASAGASIELLQRLLDPSAHSRAHLFNDVIKTIPHKFLEAMELGRHVNFKGGNRDAALRLIRYFKEHRPDMAITIESPRTETGESISSNDARVNRRSSIVQQLLQPDTDERKHFERRLSTRTMAHELVDRHIIKVSRSGSGDNDGGGEVVAGVTTAAANSGSEKNRMHSLKRFFTLRNKNDKRGDNGGGGGGGGGGVGGAAARGSVFNVPLEELLASDCEKSLVETESMDGIPLIIRGTCENLEQRAPKHVGIFRLPGNERHIRETRALLDSGLTVDFSTLHVDTVANLLKLWLRELPEPLFPFHVYDAFVDAQKTLADDDDARLLKLKATCDSLPAVNARLIAYIFAFLSRLAEHHQTHKMTARNLALVFAPNLLRPEDESSYLRVVQDTPFIMGVVHNLISHCAFFFAHHGFIGSPVNPADLDDGAQHTGVISETVLAEARRIEALDNPDRVLPLIVSQPPPSKSPRAHKRVPTTMSWSTDDHFLLDATSASTAMFTGGDDGGDGGGGGRVRSRTITDHSRPVPMFINPQILSRAKTDPDAVSDVSSISEHTQNEMDD